MILHTKSFSTTLPSLNIFCRTLFRNFILCLDNATGRNFRNYCRLVLIFFQFQNPFSLKMQITRYVSRRNQSTNFHLLKKSSGIIFIFLLVSRAKMTKDANEAINRIFFCEFQTYVYVMLIVLVDSCL